MTTFKDLWKARNGYHEKRDDRGIWVARQYFAFYDKEVDRFDVLHFSTHKPYRTPPLVAQLYPDGRIWFKAVETLNGLNKSTIENTLFGTLAGGRFEVCKNIQQRGVRFYDDLSKVICITGGAILLDSRGALLEADPPLLPVKNDELIKQYDALATEVRTNTKLRTKISQLANDIAARRTGNETTYIHSAEAFYNAVKITKPSDLNTFRQLVIWATFGSYSDKLSIEERLDKMFTYRRPQVLEYLGAVKYA